MKWKRPAIGARRRFLASVAAASALAIALVGCAADEQPTGGDAANSDEPIIVGGTLGLTGIYSGPSVGYKLAYEYWADQVNENGGILGRDVELIIYDDESNPTVAQQLYQQLINEDGADILLAPYATAVGGAIVPITERAGKVVVNAGFVSKELYQDSEYMFATFNYQENEYAQPLFEYIKSLPEDERPKTLAVVTAQNPFTLVVRDGYEGEGGVLGFAEEAGIEVVVNEEYDQTATDLSSLVSRVAQSDADMFIQLSLPNDAALLARTVEQSGYSPDIYCSCGSQVTTLPNWPDLGAAAVNVFGTTTAWPGMDNAGLDEVTDMFFEAQGATVLPAYVAAGYAAGQVIQQAIEGTESLDSDVLKDYILSNTFQTAVGDIDYNEDGTVKFGALLVQYQEGGNQVIWPSDYATGEAVRPYRAG